MKPLLILLAFLLPSLSNARIGETRAQCETRYGPVVRHGKKPGLQFYEKGDYTIGCQFGSPDPSAICEIITYFKLDDKNHFLNWDYDEIEAFKNSNGKGWLKTPVKVPAGEIEWFASWGEDDFLIANYDFKINQLTILILKQARARQAEEEKKKRLEGF